MAKLDLKSAYRMVLVRSADQHLLKIEWGRSVYSDCTLPFGLCSAPKLFTVVADKLAWEMSREGIIDVIRFLDVFFLRSSALHTALSLCEHLGFPVAPDKVEGPSTVLTFRN